MAGFRGAIFDMDGTLVESMIEWRKQNIAFAKRHGVEVPPQIRGKELESSSHRVCKLYAELYPQLGMTAEQVEHEYAQALLPIYCATVEKKKGLMPFLEMLKDRGVRMCVATATEVPVARECLAHHGILPYMEFVVSPAEVGMSKASTAFFPRVAQMLGIDSGDCAVFEDALYAVRSAREADMRVFAVEDQCAQAGWEEIRSLANVFRRDFTGLLPIVQAMFAADRVCTMHLAAGRDCD